jgi:hypothetical protein
MANHVDASARDERLVTRGSFHLGAGATLLLAPPNGNQAART